MNYSCKHQLYLARSFSTYSLHVAFIPYEPYNLMLFSRCRNLNLYVYRNLFTSLLDIFDYGLERWSRHLDTDISG